MLLHKQIVDCLDIEPTKECIWIRRCELCSRAPRMVAAIITTGICIEADNRRILRTDQS